MGIAQHCACTLLNVTELFTLKWLILCYVNFISIRLRRKRGGCLKQRPEE